MGNILWIYREISPWVDTQDTKGTLLNTSSFSSSHIDFKLVAYSYDAGSASTKWTIYPAGRVPLTMQYGSTTGTWSPEDGLLFWPAQGKMIRFYAYAPSTLPAPGSSTNGSLKSGKAPFLHFTQETAVEDQTDILVATQERYDIPEMDNLDVSLTFYHMLTAVKFKVGHGLSVTALSLEGVAGGGRLDMTEGTWSNLSTDPATFSITPSVVSGSPYDFFEDNLTLLMIPQTLPPGAQISVTVDGSSFTANLTGQVWNPGEIITYCIAR